MDPRSLAPENFAGYRPQARAFAEKHIAILRSLPLPLLSILIAQIIDYDLRFPAEQRTLDRQFDTLSRMDTTSRAALLDPFFQIELSPELLSLDWLHQPHVFNEHLSAALWSTHQIDAYREAGQAYEARLASALVGDVPSTPRFVIVLVGSGVSQMNHVLFRNLRPHGVLFTALDPKGAHEALFTLLRDRAAKEPEPYAHWYIEGGKPASELVTNPVTVLSYEALAPIAFNELNLMHRFATTPHTQSGISAEDIQSFMASLGPKELGLAALPGDATLHAFQASILTNGAGTQIFSTTFVQWTAREALRRAQPITLLARFSPRQVMASMNTMLHRDPLTQEKDVEGSLIDADMGAYYTWLNLTRLAGSEQSRFLVWFEDQRIALAIAPTLPRGTTSSSQLTMRQLLESMADASHLSSVS
ncbi:MAG TPA: hypothetical protein VGC07_08290 [Granulicella sp.]